MFAINGEYRIYSPGSWIPEYAFDSYNLLLPNSSSTVKTESTVQEDWISRTRPTLKKAQQDEDTVVSTESSKRTTANLKSSPSRSRGRDLLWGGEH